MRTIRWVVAVLAAASALGAVPHAAVARPAGRHVHPLLGAVPARGTLAPTAAAGTGNLAYHGGPVMRINRTYAIYWVPSGWSMVSGYRSTINRYFSDVAHDSGTAQNVYSTETQFGDTTGPIAYAQTFGGSTTTPDPFPVGGCPLYDQLRLCLTDAQVAAEIKRVMTVKAWTGGPAHAFFLFLPKNVGTCQSAAGTECAFTSFCAYHSWTGTGASQIIYANMPYADTDPAACGTGQQPNATEADDTLNVTSHEHREMIEDPRGTAWYDAAGNEGADKCAWTFGSALGSTASGAYNQLINTHPYYVQEEWTNAHSACVQRGI